jgi:N-acetylglucosamine kinase-like BadF-type ATPase
MCSMSSGARGRPAPSEGWVAGIDLGGTWIRAVAVDARGARRQVRSRIPARLSTAEIVQRALDDLGLRRQRVRTLVLAARGVWTTHERRQLRKALRGLATTVIVVSDAEAAHHGALAGGPGVLLLAGTGSIVLGRSNAGRWQRLGGLGPLLGDEGSAFWIGRAWLRANAAPADLPRLRRLARSPDAVARIAATAPAALRAARRGHRAARLITREAQRVLAQAVVTVARRLRLRPPVAVSWAGALMHNDPFRAGVWRELRQARLRVKPHRPRAGGAEAALQLALGAREGTDTPRQNPPDKRARRRRARPSRVTLSAVHPCSGPARATRDTPPAR